MESKGIIHALSSIVCVGICLASLTAGASSDRLHPNDTLHTKPALDRQSSSAQLEHLAMPFIANAGQTDPRVAYYAQTFAGTVFVTHDGTIVYSLDAPAGSSSQSHAHNSLAPGWTLTERLQNTAALVPQAEGQGPARVNYFIGNDRTQWRSGVGTSTGISLGEAWPGVRVDLQAQGERVQTFYRVAPGSDVRQIRLALTGSKQLSIKQGRLLAETGNGPVTFSEPRAWQVIDGTPRAVAVSYTLDHESYGFSLGTHDENAPVVIDPDFQATYLGGSGTDNIYSLRLDAAGDVYVAGFTTSTNFPGTTGGAQATNAANPKDNAFIAKLSADLTVLDQVTYLGGTNTGSVCNSSGTDVIDGQFQSDAAIALALDTSGDIYVAGETCSTNFPGTTGGAQATASFSGNGFIAKLSPDLTVLDQATYLGNGSMVKALALDSAGDVYAAGQTQSSSFPGTTGGAEATQLGFAPDAFVAKLSPDLKTLVQSSYISGSNIDDAHAIAIDSSGDVYVTGVTNSSDLPATSGGAVPTLGTSSTSYIAKLNPGLTAFEQVTYLGSSGTSPGVDAVALALDASGDVYVGGFGPAPELPASTGGAQSIATGTTSSFIAKLNPSLTAFDQVTYLGGSLGQFLHGLVIDANGNVYATGSTTSTDFPGTTLGVQAANAGGSNGNAFIAELNPGLTTIKQATYLGGNAAFVSRFSDYGMTLALDTAGDVYVAGAATSTDFPNTTGGAQPSNGGGIDGFIAKLPGDLKAQVQLDLNISPPAQSNLGATFGYSLTVTNNSSDTAATGVVLTDTLPGNVIYISSSTNTGSCADVGQTVTCNLGSLAANGGSAGVTIQVSGSATGTTANVGQISADQVIMSGSIVTANVPTIIMLSSNATAGSVDTQAGNAVSGVLSGSGSGVLTYNISVPPTHGNAVLTNANTGAFTYTPASGYSGTDQFSFTVNGAAGTSSAAVENITVDPIPASSGGGGGTPTKSGGGGFEMFELLILGLLAHRRRRAC